MVLASDGLGYVEVTTATSIYSIEWQVGDPTTSHGTTLVLNCWLQPTVFEKLHSRSSMLP